MTTSIGRRIRVIAAMVALVAAAGSAVGLASGTSPAGAATTNPCKVIKRSEIQRAFGGVVSAGRKGVATPSSSQCEFQVGAAADRPPGTVVVHVTTTDGKAAFTRLQKNGAYRAVDGVDNAVFADKLHVVDILSGSVLLAVQGGFRITDPLAIHAYDDQAQLTQLAQIGAERL